MSRLNKDFAILFAVLVLDVTYLFGVNYWAEHSQGWEGFLMFVYLLPPGVAIGFATMAKLIAHLIGAKIGWITALVLGCLGLFVSFLAFMQLDFPQ